MPGNKVLRTQSRKVVYNVYKFMEKQAEEGPHCYPNDSLLRTSKATGISVKTVHKILNDSYDTEHKFSEHHSKLDSDILSKSKINKNNTLDRDTIKKCVYNFYITENILPSVKQLLIKLKQENKFKGSIKNLRRILRELGFRKNQIGRNRCVLIEGTNVRLKRIEYLKTITNYRNEGRTIIYTGESYIDYSLANTITFSDNGSHKNKAKVHRVIIAHAASNAGLVPNALFMYKDYCTKMTYDSYCKWICTKVIPNVPKNSVIIISNASYNNKLEESVLTANSRRSEMESWLTEKGISFSSQMLKPQLFKLISSHEEYSKKYKIDCIIEDNNHTVLRIPSHHPDFNPMKIVFEDVEDYVAKRNINLNVNTTKKLIAENLRSMKEKDWNTVFEKIKTIEEEYENIDIIIDKLTDEINFHDNYESDVDMNVDDSDKDDTDTSLDDGQSEDNVFCSNEEEIDIKYDPDTLDPLSK